MTQFSFQRRTIVFEHGNSVVIEFSLSRQNFFKSLAIFCHDKKLFGRDRIFFSGSCHLLSCLLRHRIICCETISLVILKSSSISFVTYFSLSLPNFIIH